MALIEELFQDNTGLEHVSSSNYLINWYTLCNKICNQLGVSIKYRNSIPRSLRNENEIRAFVEELKANSSEWRAMKLVTLGHGRIGKTTLLSRMRSLIDSSWIHDVCTFIFCQNVHTL
jgi:hypothetical protein